MSSPAAYKRRSGSQKARVKYHCLLARGARWASCARRAQRRLRFLMRATSLLYHAARSAAAVEVLSPTARYAPRYAAQYAATIRVTVLPRAPRHSRLTRHAPRYMPPQTPRFARHHDTRTRRAPPLRIYAGHAPRDIPKFYVPKDKKMQRRDA